MVGTPFLVAYFITEDNEDKMLLTVFPLLVSSMSAWNMSMSTWRMASSCISPNAGRMLAFMTCLRLLMLLGFCFFS